jgi:hypothetical protein
MPSADEYKIKIEFINGHFVHITKSNIERAVAFIKNLVVLKNGFFDNTVWYPYHTILRINAQRELYEVVFMRERMKCKKIL